MWWRVAARPVSGRPVSGPLVGACRWLTCRRSSVTQASGATFVTLTPSIRGDYRRRPRSRYMREAPNKSLGFGGVRFPRNVGSPAWLGRSRADVRRGVCCPCAGVGAVAGFRVPEDAPECPGQLVCVARGSAAGHDRGVLPVTPFSLWCLVPGNKSGAGGDHAGWVLSLRARRSDSVFPAPLPGQLPAGSRSREARRR